MSVNTKQTCRCASLLGAACSVYTQYTLSMCIVYTLKLYSIQCIDVLYFDMLQDSGSGSSIRPRSFWPLSTGESLVQKRKTLNKPKVIRWENAVWHYHLILPLNITFQIGCVFDVCDSRAPSTRAPNIRAPPLPRPPLQLQTWHLEAIWKTCHLKNIFRLILTLTEWAEKLKIERATWLAIFCLYFVFLPVLFIVRLPVERTGLF